jgi:D-psicose/D-tagatose/L-ribulose 3-epimerase
MKFSFSNLAWDPDESKSAEALLKQHGISGLEIVPTRIWPNWEGATAAAAQQYRKHLADLGFEVAAVQGALFGHPDARLFATRGKNGGVVKWISQLSFVAELAGALGAPTVVLAAPQQRSRKPLSKEIAFDRAAEVLQRLAEVFHAHGTCLCIEPNPRQYNCNFIINAREGGELVRRVNHPGFGLTLDTASMFLENETLAQVWPEVGAHVRHIHVSEPNLNDFHNPFVPHTADLKFLSTSGYSGWVSFTMREPRLSLAAAGPWSILQSVR